MPHLLFLAVSALATGLAGGLTLDERLLVRAPVVVTAALVTSLLGHAHRRPRLASCGAAVAGSALAAMYGTAALDGALHPPLRALLDARFGGFALESADGPGLETPVVVEGRLREDAVSTGETIVLRLDLERLWLDGRSQHAAAGASLGVVGTQAHERVRGWTAGRRIRAPAILDRPTVYRNAGVPDHERALARRGTALVGTIKSAALVELSTPGRWWEEAAARVRWRVRDAMARWMAPRDARAAAVATAILIGDRTALDADVERALQAAGTYHVIAISGGNVAIFAALVLGLLGLAGWRGRGAATLAIVMVVAYGAIAEGGPSVARATTIAAIYLTVRLIDLRTPATQALLLAAGGMLLLTPLAIADVGFWLTFGASTAIVLGVGRTHRADRGWRALPIDMLCASIAVEAVLLPVAALAFERVTVAGLGLNFVAIPAMTLVQVAAMALVAADTLSLDAASEGLAWLAALGANALLESARVVNVAPWLTWRVPAPAATTVALYYAALVTWWWASASMEVPRRRRSLARASGICALALAFIVAAKPQDLWRAAGDGQLHLTLFDVGQGDAALVTFPNGRTLLVDTGGLSRGTFDIGDRVLGPALRARGVRRLDYLAITHADPDHIGGAEAIVSDFAPREIWVGIDVAGHAPTARLREAAAVRRTAWRTLRRGSEVDIAGVRVLTLHPSPPDWERQRVRNDDSLVLDLRFGQVGMLLTGDIGREVEQELVPLLTPSPIAILKVPHHGSATSSSAGFLAAVRPTVALIGVGRGNLFGHPVPGVLARYQAAATRVLRTDRDGQIDVRTDGTELSVRTWSEQNNTKGTKATKAGTENGDVGQG